MINTKKSLASIILLSYQQEKFVDEAINSLLEQTYSPLEIIISDDASKDRTQDIILEITKKYKGPHQIKINFNEVNLGLCGNINKALSICDGEFIFAAAGDDISHPDRCKIVMDKWLELDKKPDLIATDAYDMAVNGEILGIKHTSHLEAYKGLEDWIQSQPYFFGSSHSWSKHLIKKFPPLNPNLAAEDHVMVFRAILANGAATISQPLVKHRRGGVTLKKYLTLQQKKNKLKIGFKNKLTYLHQLLEDANNHVHHEKLQKFLSAELLATQFSFELFNTSSFFKKINACLKAEKVPLNLKFRILTYTSFSWILKPIFWVKKYIKRY